MAINGVMFWSLVLDSRPKPPARYSHLMRALMILIIELPQMVLGAILSLSMTDYYPVYEICGRILPMTALNDQHYGGLIIWLPGTLTSFAAMIVVLWTMRINEEKDRSDPTASIADRQAILAHFGSAPIDPVLRVPHDRLVAAEGAGAGHDRVAALRQFCFHGRIEAGLHLHEVAAPAVRR